MTRALLTWFLLSGIVLSSRADRIDDYVASQMAQKQIPGVAIAVVRDGRVVKSKGYGRANIELEVPVTEETVFEIGSLTKQFTATLVMMLVEQGKVGVDDPIKKYLTEVPEAWSNVTVRHLLTHTSGITNYTGLTGFEWSKHLSSSQFIQALAPYPLAFPPGETFSYCNSGYNLLGFMIEKVTGAPYWQVLSEKILQPLGMRATQERDPQRIILNRADGYEKQKQKLTRRNPELTDIFSAGAIASTVLDLMKWNAALESGKLLKRSTLQQMWTPVKFNNGKLSTYGLGFNIEDRQGIQSVGHNGSTAGFSASLQRFPGQNLSVIVLSNLGEQGVGASLARGVADFFLIGSSRPAPAR